MNTLNKKNFYRWVLLRHTGAKDDFGGVHFDLLLEDKNFCRTWRLSHIPVLDGHYVHSLYVSPHNLYWLDVKEKLVSGNRGLATRIKKGIFWESLPTIDDGFINLSLKWEDMRANLVIDDNGCRICTKRY